MNDTVSSNRLSKREMIAIDDDESISQPAEKIAKNIVEPLSSPPIPPSPELVELQQKVIELEEKYQRACLATKSAEIRAERAETLLDSKDGILDDSMQEHHKSDHNREKFALKEELEAAKKREFDLTRENAELKADMIREVKKTRQLEEELKQLRIERTKNHEMSQKPDFYGEKRIVDEDSENVDVETMESFTCQWDSCENTYSTQKALVEHVNHHMKPYKCTWKGCEREEPFNARYLLVEHMRGHTGEKPFVCPLENCQKSYLKMEHLKNHTRIHTGEKPYKCEFPNCRKAFSNPSDRAKHHNRTHSDSKPYHCTSCEKSYTDPSSLRKHMISAHGKEVYEKTRKNKPVYPACFPRNTVPIATQIQLGQLLPSTKGKPNKYFNPQKYQQECQEVSDRAVATLSNGLSAPSQEGDQHPSFSSQSLPDCG